MSSTTKTEEVLGFLGQLRTDDETVASVMRLIYGAAPGRLYRVLRWVFPRAELCGIINWTCLETVQEVKVFTDKRSTFDAHAVQIGETFYDIDGTVDVNCKSVLRVHEEDIVDGAVTVRRWLRPSEVEAACVLPPRLDAALRSVPARASGPPVAGITPEGAHLAIERLLLGDEGAPDIVGGPLVLGAPEDPDERPGRRVVCAALRNAAGRVVCGPRHFDAVMQAQLATEPEESWLNCQQGFVDQDGLFMDRLAARVLAGGNGQMLRRVHGDGMRLFSENLY
jgi:hypothetical protein